jgi:hypothetical protein
LSEAESIYRYLLRKAEVSAVFSRLSPDDAAMERTSIRSEAEEYSAMGYSLVNDTLVFTGKTILEKFRRV